MSVANERICSTDVVICMISRDSTYLMEGSSEILPVIVCLPKVFELLLSKTV